MKSKATAFGSISTAFSCKVLLFVSSIIIIIIVIIIIKIIIIIIMMIIIIIIIGQCLFKDIQQHLLIGDSVSCRL